MQNKFKNLSLLKLKSISSYGIVNIFITTDKRELGKQFHSLQSNLHELCTMFHRVIYFEACNLYNILS